MKIFLVEDIMEMLGFLDSFCAIFQNAGKIFTYCLKIWGMHTSSFTYNSFATIIFSSKVILIL